MIDDIELGSFTDASKVISSRVELTWPRHDLYGLLWQYMANAQPGGDAFRAMTLGWTTRDSVQLMPESLRRDETAQRSLFGNIAGTKMGTNERRGLPYTWIPTHLADAKRVATPRSFIAALRTATDETPDTWKQAIHWRGVQSGVRRASEYRVRELAEDFLWTSPVMKALEGLPVPCERVDIINRWNLKRVLAAIDGLTGSQRNRRAALGVAGLIDDLRDIGVLEVRPNGRFNIPDVYRVGFGLKRKGGVPPVR